MSWRGPIAATLTLATAAAAGPMAGPRSIPEEPLAVRGSVMMLPLVADQPGNNWPATLSVRTEDGRVLHGPVAWAHPAAAPARLRWTDDPRGLAVRAITSTDDTSPGLGSPLLLVHMPRDVSGALQLGSQVIRPRWIDPAVAVSAGQAPLLREEATNRPDPDSPFEYWRWVLLAEALDRTPPPASDYGPIESDVARHFSDLWQAALHRLGLLNGRVRQRCVRMLTFIAHDRTQPIGAWVADPVDVGELLQMLLEPERRDREIVLGASRWVDKHGWFIFRDAPALPREVTVSAINRAEFPIRSRLRWLGDDDYIAIVTLDPGVLARIELDRPGPGGTSPLATDVQAMLIEAGGQLRRLAFAGGALAARPPGVQFALRPSLTLADVQAARRRAADPARATVVQLRRLEGRWELFVDCRRPPAGEKMPRAGRGLAAEEVTLLFGEEPTTATLVVPETGRWRLTRGADNGTLEVHRRSWPDRWLCRVLIPDPWLHGNDLGALIGAVRRHGDGESIETGPFASLPWRPLSGRAVIDLATWSDLPVSE